MTWDETQGTVSARLEAPSEAPAAASVVDGWSRLFTYLVVAIVVGIAVVMPFLGLFVALAGASYLRAGDVHTRRREGGLLRMVAGPLTTPFDLVRGTVVTLVTVPYAAVFAILVPMAIMAGSVGGVEVSPLVAAAWGAGVAAYVLWAAPGVRAPRRHLVRVFTALVPEPRRIAAVGALLCVMTLLVAVAAIALQPSFAPMYALKNSIAQELARFQDSLQQRAS